MKLFTIYFCLLFKKNYQLYKFFHKLRDIYTKFHHSKNLNYIGLRLPNFISFKSTWRSFKYAPLKFRTSALNISHNMILSLALNRSVEQITEIRLWLRLLDHFIGDVVYTGFGFIDSPRPPSIAVEYAGQ